MFDINDGQEATEVTTELMKWSEEMNCHIVVVLHQNKGDNNARGHLGTEIVNKAETVISVTKDSENPNNSIVAPEYCREKEFEPFAFSVDHKGVPYIINNWINDSNTAQGVKRKLTANQIPDQQHLKVLKEMFEYLDNPTHGKLLEPLSVAFQKRGGDLAEKRTKQFLAYYNSKGWIKGEKVKGIKYPVYKLG